MNVLKTILTKHKAFKSKLAEPAFMKDQQSYKKVLKDFQRLTPIVTAYEAHEQVLTKIKDYEAMLQTEQDTDVRKLIVMELENENAQAEKLAEAVKLALVSSETENFESLIMEIRAGTGGEEASLFAADLVRMYAKLAERRKWQMEILNQSLSGVKGYKEVSFMIKGKEAYATLKHETGTHRVQRVPETESSGRIHTSAVTVAVLGEVPAEELEVRMEDLKIDTYRASGAGGQHVNTTDSAIRITHLPSGIVVTCQDERSQYKNKERALKILRARLYNAQQEKLRSERANERKQQVGSGDRSEKIRTYNFPQGRVSDHRTQVTTYNLQAFLNGDLDEIITSLKEHEKTLALKNFKF